MKYVCQVCGFIYDPEVGDPDNGVAPGTPFEELPEDWVAQFVVHPRTCSNLQSSCRSSLI